MVYFKRSIPKQNFVSKTIEDIDLTLNSFYERYSDRNTTLRKLKNLIKSFNKSDGPYLLVTHYVNILAFTGLSTSSGGMVAYNLNTKVSTHIKLND